MRQFISLMKKFIIYIYCGIIIKIDKKERHLKNYRLLTRKLLIKIDLQLKTINTLFEDNNIIL